MQGTQVQSLVKELDPTCHNQEFANHTQSGWQVGQGGVGVGALKGERENGVQGNTSSLGMYQYLPSEVML